MNSDIVKFAVDFLTGLLNAINKVTEGFGGLTSSFSKIGMLIAIFQTAKTIVGKFFDEIISKIYTSAFTAGEKIAKGTKDGINSANQEQGNKKIYAYSNIKEGAGQMK
jgi:hypothetical protein